MRTHFARVSTLSADSVMIQRLSATRRTRLTKEPPVTTEGSFATTGFLVRMES